MPKCEGQATELQARASLGSPTHPRLICRGGIALGVLVKGSSVPVTCVTANVQLGCCPHRRSGKTGSRLSRALALGRAGRGQRGSKWGLRSRAEVCVVPSLGGLIQGGASPHWTAPTPAPEPPAKLWVDNTG